MQGHHSPQNHHSYAEIAQEISLCGDLFLKKISEVNKKWVKVLNVWK